MTTLNFGLTRALARDRLRAGDEILVTRLDHDANVSPWLARRRRPRPRPSASSTSATTARSTSTTWSASSATRRASSPSPGPSNAVGTVNDVPRIAALAHEAGALAWVDAVHYAPHGPIDVAASGADVLLCSPYKFFGPHLGPLLRPRGAARRAAPVQGAPRARRAARPRASSPARSSTSSSPASSPRSSTWRRLGWDAIQRARARRSSERFLGGLPDGVTLYGAPDAWTAARRPSP